MSCIYIYTYTHIYTYIYTHIYIYVRIYIHTHTHTHIYVCVCVCVRVCVRVCVWYTWCKQVCRQCVETRLKNYLLFWRDKNFTDFAYLAKKNSGFCTTCMIIFLFCSFYSHSRPFRDVKINDILCRCVHNESTWRQFFNFVFFPNH